MVKKKKCISNYVIATETKKNRKKWFEKLLVIVFLDWPLERSKKAKQKHLNLTCCLLSQFTNLKFNKTRLADKVQLQIVFSQEVKSTDIASDKVEITSIINHIKWSIHKRVFIQLAFFFQNIKLLIDFCGGQCCSFFLFFFSITNFYYYLLFVRSLFVIFRWSC